MIERGGMLGERSDKRRRGDRKGGNDRRGEVIKRWE